MASVTRENIGLLNEKLIVKVEKDDYLPSFEKAIKNYSKQANIPGFRKGMVPVGMVKKMYGSSVFADEVIKSVEKELSDFMGSEKLEIFAQPLPLQEDTPNMDMNQPAEYAFAFEIGLKPEFTLADLGSMPLTRYKITVTDEMVNEAIEQFQVRYGTKITLDAITAENNELEVTIMQNLPEEDETTIAKEKDFTLKVSDFTPTFCEQLMGKKPDDELELQLSRDLEESKQPSVITGLEYTREDALAPDTYFTLIINEISVQEKPEMNEAFFKQVFTDKDITTEEGFRNELIQEIQTQLDGDSRLQLDDQIYHGLLRDTHIDFPADFLKRWMATSGDKPKTPEQVEQEFPTFANQLKWTLITEKLAADQSVNVQPEEMRTFAKQQLLSYMGGQFIDIEQPWINDYVERMMKDKKFVEDTFHRIRTDKIFAWAETQIHPVETPITKEDFKRLQEEHHHHH